MKLRIVSAAACTALLIAPTLAQSDEQDGELDIDSVDALLGNQVVTEPEEDQGDAAGEDAPVPDGDEGETEEAEGDEAIAFEEPPSEPTDLDRAYAHYAQCVAESGVELEAADFAIDDIGEEAVLRCAGARAAYVNAFYFSLVPRYPGLAEPAIRATAERLVRATDEFLATKAVEDATLLRAERPVDEEVQPE